MSLLRLAGRTMLASYFIVNGAKTALKPEELVPDAQPIAERVVPLAQRLAPPSVAPYIPEDTKTLVRLSGVAQVLGGLGLATGIGRRPSSAILAASMVPHVVASRPAQGASPEEKRAARSIMLRNIALLGAALIAAQDTEGSPSLAWRAHDASGRLTRKAEHEKNGLAKDAEKLSKSAKKQLKQARKDTAKQVKAAQKKARKQVGAVAG